MAHICHVATTFNSRSILVHRVAPILAAIRAAGHRASLIVGRDHDLEPDSVPGVEVRIVPELVKYVDPVRDARAPRAIARALRALRPDVAHTHLAKAGILGRWAARRAGVPRIVHTVHGPTFAPQLAAHRRWLYRALERRAGRWTDAFVFTGQELRHSYIAAGVCSAANSRVIYTAHGADQLGFHPPTAAVRQQLRRELCAGHAPQLLLACIGRLVPSKRVDESIAILAELRRGGIGDGIDAHLLVVGAGMLPSEQAYAGQLRTLATRLAVAERVHFLGHRPQVMGILHAADAVVMTSRWEGLPNIAVEAVLAGTPLLCYDVFGVREVAADLPGCRIARPGDRRALVDAARALIVNPVRDDPSYATRQEQLRQMFPLQRMLDDTLHLYDQLL